MVGGLILLRNLCGDGRKRKKTSYSSLLSSTPSSQRKSATVTHLEPNPPRSIPHRSRNPRYFTDDEARSAVNGGLRRLFQNKSEDELSPRLNELRKKLKSRLKLLLEKQREFIALEDDIGDPGELPKIHGQSMEAVLEGVGVSKWNIVLMQKQNVDLMRVVSFEQEDWMNLGIEDEYDKKRIIEAYYLCKAAGVDPCKSARLRNTQDAIGKSPISQTGEALAPLVNPFRPIGPELPLFYDDRFREEMSMEARKIQYEKELAARAAEATTNVNDDDNDDGEDAAPAAGGASRTTQKTPLLTPAFLKDSSLIRIFKNGEGPENYCCVESEGKQKYYMPPTTTMVKQCKGGRTQQQQQSSTAMKPWNRWKWDSYYVKCREPFERLVRYKGSLRSFLRKKLHPTDRILVLGCGLSELSHGLYMDGYFFITNIDFSQEAIRIMQDRSQNQFKKMTWQVLDVTDMHSIQNKTYDVVIDKGLMDSMLMLSKGEEHCGGGVPPQATNRVRVAVNEVYRVLKPGGTFLQFSAQSPEIRLGLLAGCCVDKDSNDNRYHRNGLNAKQKPDAAAAAPRASSRSNSGGGVLYWTISQEALLPQSKDQQWNHDKHEKRDIDSQHQELLRHQQQELLPFVFVCQKPRLLGSTLLPLQEITHTPFAPRPMDLRSEEEIQKQPLGPENLPAPRAFYKPQRANKGYNM
eukprot:CAMPEP_0185262352 /NCGR_PEP_ID=MMETSP1359-20130426/10525_1 /TAXON_ID=552665 /ORGANISM="Bigelowiella longifila, Strain CCMP242" /LENGTH=689 /DNA_ID=CAMNT_0027849269 /DNA_START=151 /DNA_END=2220 /DNA_ORIENTATION=+